MESASGAGWDTADLLIGAALVIFGFLLAVAWEKWTTRRDRRRRDRSMLRAAQAEVEAMLVLVQNDQNLVTHELSLIPQGQRLINPLDPVEAGFWNLVKLDPPAALLKDPDALTMIQDVSRRTDQVAEMIRSRETFRVSNQALSGFLDQLKQYDELLQRFQAELLTALNDLKPVVADAAAHYE